MPDHPARLLAAVALALTLTSTATARADTTATSTIAQLRVVSRAHAHRALYHGALWLQYDKQKRNYRWGGAHCGGKTLAPAELEMLFEAFRSRLQVTLDFERVRHDDRTYTCITGFTVTHS